MFEKPKAWGRQRREKNPKRDLGSQITLLEAGVGDDFEFQSNNK